MSNKIRFVELQELCNSITDCHHSTPLYVESGKIVIRNFNIKNGRLQLDDISYTDEENYLLRTSRAIPEAGDLIITREAPMGEVCIIPENLECCLGQRMVLLKPNHRKVDSNYLLYTLMSKYVQTHISKSEGTGSIVSNLRIPVLKELIIPIFDLKRQTYIGKILSDIDSKIALNNRINAELEAMAKTVYDYWFVQFDFPNTQGKPYKSSGGKMVWCEELKREIPEGWEVQNIEKCCSIVDCLHSKKSDYSFEDENSYLLQLENILDNGLIDLTNKYFVSKNDYEKWTSRIEVKENDIVITNAGRVAATAQIPNEIKTGIGRNITAIRPNSISPTYLFLSFRGLDMIRQIKWNTDSGAFFSSLNVKGIKQLHIVRPPSEIETKFEDVVHSFRRQREQNQQENQQLSSLRDWLLPMLMNGQVTVGDSAITDAMDGMMAAEGGVGYGK